MNEKRKDWIEKQSEKDVKTLAAQLWACTSRIKTLKDQNSMLRRDLLDHAIRDSYDSFISQENANMGEVLKTHGIFPTRLRVTYMTRDENVCEGCEGFFDCHSCENDFFKTVITKTFYLYRISPDVITGITGDFKEIDICNLIEVADDTTGKIIWKAEE